MIPIGLISGERTVEEQSSKVRLGRVTSLYMPLGDLSKSLENAYNQTKKALEIKGF